MWITFDPFSTRVPGIYRPHLSYWFRYIRPLNNDVITSKRHFDVITSKWRRFDVITTLLLHHVFSWVDSCLYGAQLHRSVQSYILVLITTATSNGSWCMGIKGEMSGTVCVTFTWDTCMYIYMSCLFITVTWWYVWCFEWASGNQEEVQACLVTLWLFIISCYSLYKTTLGLLCSWFENNPHFHKYSMDFHV